MLHSHGKLIETPEGQECLDRELSMNVQQGRVKVSHIVQMQKLVCCPNVSPLAATACRLHILILFRSTILDKAARLICCFPNTGIQKAVCESSATVNAGVGIPATCQRAWSAAGPAPHSPASCCCLLFHHTCCSNSGCCLDYLMLAKL